MKSLFTALFLIIATQKLTAQIQSQPITIGESLTFHSEILNQERTVNIFLPNDYSADSAQTYHVIYLLDGSMDEDFIHIAGLIQFANFPWINLAPKSIVVGISNMDRQHDYVFPTDKEEYMKELPSAGGSENFMNFIASELQPLIEKTYKTDATKTIIGQSLGGLLAAEILFKRSELFDNYLIISPSLWWDAESLLETQKEATFSADQVYVAVGKEGKVMQRTAKELYKLLRSNSDSKETIHYQYFEENDHGDVLHIAIYNGLQKIFPKYK